jgi:uncharacterized protein YciI
MWYIVLSRSLSEQETNKQLHYEEHRQWLDDQHRAGRLLFSGPTTDGAYGIYMMLAASLSEAQTIAAQDPHQLGVLPRTLFVIPFGHGAEDHND